MKQEMTNNVIRLLQENPQVSDYKINIHKKQSFELFFVRGKLETVRATDTADREVTVYTDHDGFRGDAQFSFYTADSLDALQEKIAGAVRNASLICNAPYTLPEGETGDYDTPSNLGNTPMDQLAHEIAQLVFSANTLEGGSLNSVEIFLNEHEDSVCNSRGLQKTQHRWTAMAEAIPTFNGEKESVELYEQYNFSALDPQALVSEIADMMTAVKARYEAKKPDFPMDCPVVLGKLELNDLFTAVADDLNYATVYGHGNLYHKGDRLQKEVLGDPITLSMKGSVPGNVCSAHFDGDGLTLGEVTLVDQGKVVNYYGSNRFGQYLQETPTGNLSCLCVEPGTANLDALKGKPYLEVISMSGLQVDFFNDYIGGEIRLACYHDGERSLPVTGISIAGKLQEVLCAIRLSGDTAVHDGYVGPSHAILNHMKIF